MQDAGATALLTLVVPVQASVRVELDDVALPPERFNVEVALRAGPHKVHAEGTIGREAQAVVADQIIDLAPGEHVSKTLALRPAPVLTYEGADPVSDCLLRAITQEEVQRCAECRQNHETYEARAACVRGGCGRCSVDVDTTSTAAAWPLLIALAMHAIRRRTRRPRRGARD